MDYSRNIDRIDRWNTWTAESRLSYNQVIDVSRETISTPLFTVAEFKSDFAKIDTTAENSLIGLLITTATLMCENHVNMNFTTRQTVAIINNSNGGTYLPYGPISDVTSVHDIDDTALTADQYKITGTLFKQIQWPKTDWLSILYYSGYGQDTEPIPENLVTSVKMQTLYLFEHRGDNNAGMSPDVKKILNPLIRK